MTYARDDFDTLPVIPSWITSARAEAPEDAAFLSGAALGHLDVALALKNIPHALLRDRLALRAAEIDVAQAGRIERAGALRDSLAFLRPGEAAGPAGEVFLSWRRVVERPVSVRALHRALPRETPEQIATWLEAGAGAPVARAAGVLQTVREDRPRSPATALVLADAALARALGWTHTVPLLALGLKRDDRRQSGDGLQAACTRAVTAAAIAIVREAADVTRRAARLQTVAPKLRARGAEEAVACFLTREAVAPGALTSLRSDRAARRFCDRLVALGAVRELTGRDTFRLYGV